MRRLLVALLLYLPGPALAEKVALLVGNSDYAVPDMDLRNPVHDVAALGEALRDVGFTVTEVTDRDVASIRAALAEFETAAAAADMAVFFYAGHGVQIGGENHLVGTDFVGGDLGALRRASLTMGEVRASLVRAVPAIGVIILDACRNNPFTDKGLVRPGLVRSEGAAGLLIAYATDPGNVAYDGAGRNSVFTAGLLEHVATPGLDARLMFGRVRQQVVLETGGRQIPWVEESVLGEHAFAPSAGTETDDPQSEEIARWRAIAASRDTRDFAAYIADYPDGLFAGVARERLDALSETGQSGGAGPASAILAGTEPERLAAALAALGYLGSEAPQPESLTRALYRYQGQLPDPDALTETGLVTDAARASLFLAATTLQRLRTDIVALRSVERAMKIANDALEGIAEIASADPAAEPVLRRAERDVADIRRSRSVVLRRLDQSRTYYDELLTRAVKFFPADASVALLLREDRTRSLDASGQRLTENAEIFLRHVAQADETRKGSYQWLADLVSTE